MPDDDGGVTVLDTVLYLCLAVAHLALLLLMLLAARRHRWGPDASAVLYAVTAALVLDNAVVGLGRFVGTGSLLEALSYVRFWAHAFVTPTLVIFSWSVLARAGVPWARTAWARSAAVAATVALVAVEVALETWGLHLVPEREYGLVRYVSAEPADGPPVMVLLVTVALVAAGAVLWRRTGWPWMLVGSVVMAVGSAVPIDVPSAAVTNAFELALLTSLVATRAARPRAPQRGSRASRLSATPG